jgi:hypothetical protein
MMRKILSMAIVAGLIMGFMFACNQTDTEQNLLAPSALREGIKEQKPSLMDEIFAKLQKEAQTFKVESRKGQVEAKFKCKEGTIIVVKSLKTAKGEPFDGVGLVKIQEFYTTGDMVIGGLQTENNGKILVSGGSLNIDAKDAQGNNLVVVLDAVLPPKAKNKGLEKQMQEFVGQAANEKVPAFNWQPVRNEQSTVTPMPFGGYTMADLSNGYRNCDALYDYLPSNPKTQFDVQVTGIDMSNSQYYGTNDTKVYLFVKNYTTVINIYTPNANQGVKTYQNTIPKGLQGVLLVVTTKNGALKVAQKPITVVGNDVFTLNPQPASVAQLQAILQSLSNI